MAAMPNICGASVQHDKIWLTPTTRVPCSNAAKTRNPLKFVGVPQTPEPISAVSGRTLSYYEDMWRRHCCVTSFFPIVNTCLSCEDTAQQSCVLGPRWRFFASYFLRPVFPVSRMQHVSDLHLKFALKPHHVSKYGRHPLCDRCN